MDRVVVLAPMDTEERAARRAMRRGRVHGVAVVRTGLGRARVERAVQQLLDASGPGADVRPRVLILFGLAGALTDGPDAPRVTRVIDEQGGGWDVPVPPPLRPGDLPATVVGVDRLVMTPAAKSALRSASGASIVDMESHAFAGACVAAGVPFAVVRGVSDAPHHRLPEQTLNWVTPEGRSRPALLLRDVARRPWLAPTVARTIPQVFRGLRGAGARLVELLRGEDLRRVSR